MGRLVPSQTRCSGHTGTGQLTPPTPAASPANLGPHSLAPTWHRLRSLTGSILTIAMIPPPPGCLPGSPPSCQPGTALAKCQLLKGEEPYVAPVSRGSSAAKLILSPTDPSATSPRDPPAIHSRDHSDPLNLTLGLQGWRFPEQAAQHNVSTTRATLGSTILAHQPNITERPTAMTGQQHQQSPSTNTNSIPCLGHISQ